MADDFVTIEHFESVGQAGSAEALIEMAGITVLLADEYVPLATMGNLSGTVKLRVPSKDAERAKAVIKQMREDIEARRAAFQSIPEGCCLECGMPMHPAVDTCGICGWSYAS